VSEPNAQTAMRIQLFSTKPNVKKDLPIYNIMFFSLIFQSFLHNFLILQIYNIFIVI
jgi:hypothetical protein